MPSSGLSGYIPLKRRFPALQRDAYYATESFRHVDAATYNPYFINVFVIVAGHESGYVPEILYLRKLIVKDTAPCHAFEPYCV